MQSTNSKAVSILKAVAFCIVFILFLMGLSMIKGFFGDDSERLVYGIIGIIAGFIATFIFLKIDRKRFADIGLVFDRKTVGKFLVGVIAGIIIMGSMAVGVLYFTNTPVEFNKDADPLNFLIITLPLVPLAFMEELAFRAYPLELLKEKVDIRQSIYITALLFGLYHIVNGWGIALSLYGPGVWGLVYGLAAVYSKGIAMPTGVHYASNLTTVAFGGKEFPVGLWTVRQTADPASTNGVDWATIIPVASLLVFGVLSIELYIRRKNRRLS